MNDAPWLADPLGGFTAQQRACLRCVRAWVHETWRRGGHHEDTLETRRLRFVREMVIRRVYNEGRQRWP